MWKWILLTMTAITLYACQGQAENSNKDAAETEVNQVSDNDALVARVQEIYAAVFKEYNEEDSLRNLDLLEGQGAYAHRDELNQNFCSKEWNQLLRQIDEIDSLYHDGEMGFWDADYWIMGQDWHNLSISDVEVLWTGSGEAKVGLNLHNFDTVSPLTLKLVEEDGVWKIDDFLDVDSDFSWKTAMQEYVKEETSKKQ